VTVRVPPASGGLYDVCGTERGTEIGRSIVDVNGDERSCRSNRNSGQQIPPPVRCSGAVLQKKAALCLGDQFIELIHGPGRPRAVRWRDGVSFRVGKVRILPKSELADATNRALQAIPQDHLHTVVRRNGPKPSPGSYPNCHHRSTDRITGDPRPVRRRSDPHF